MNWVNKITALALTAFFLGSMFFSLFHMSMGMDMSAGGMVDCPFMSASEVICPMDLVGHILAWKSVFAAALPTLALLLIAAGAVALTLAFSAKVLDWARTHFFVLCRWLDKRLCTFLYRRFQDLFSSGILNPKLY
jgi:hypothetical protein